MKAVSQLSIANDLRLVLDTIEPGLGRYRKFS